MQEDTEELYWQTPLEYFEQSFIPIMYSFILSFQTPYCSQDKATHLGNIAEKLKTVNKHLS